MSLRWRIGAILTLACLLGSAACSDPEAGGTIVRPRASAAPSAAPGGLSGGVSGGSNTDPIVQYVRLDVTALSLNAPMPPGATLAGLDSTATLSARAVLTDGQTDPSGVTWQVVDAQRLEVDATGLVSVKPGAPVGVSAVTAVSKRNPALKAQAAVTVTRDGILQLTGLPDGSGYLQANVTRNGSFVTNQILDESARIRLPEGSPYEVQIQRILGGGNTLVADFTDLGIVPNGLTTARF